MLRNAGAQVWRVGFNAGERAFWFGAPGYTDMVVKELVPAIDARFRTIAEAWARANAGSGRGANVALQGAHAAALLAFTRRLSEQLGYIGNP